MTTYTLRFDGGSNPNPGPTAGAFVIYDEDGTIVEKGGSFLPQGTNNIGEYTGLIKGLEKCLEMKITDVNVEGDSMLVISQVTGKWKVNHDHLKVLCAKAKDLVKQFRSITLTHIRREFNKDADGMSDLVLEKKMDL